MAVWEDMQNKLDLFQKGMSGKANENGTTMDKVIGSTSGLEESKAKLVCCLKA